MKKIELTQNKYALVSDQDYEYINSFNWHAVKKSKCGKDAFYAYRTEVIGGKKTSIPMHRFLLSAPNDMQVDHINGDSLDNTRGNIRLCTQTQNNANFFLSTRNKSGYKGVSWCKAANKWRASILKQGKQKHLGVFGDKKEAALSYNAAAIIYFGEFARINNL